MYNKCHSATEKNWHTTNSSTLGHASAHDFFSDGQQLLAVTFLTSLPYDWQVHANPNTNLLSRTANAQFDSHSYNGGKI